MLAGLDIELSEKELRLVYLRIAKGMQAKEISQEIGLTVSSVYSSIKNIKEKTGMDIGPLYEFLRVKGLFN
jgi:DNA-binding CsgD family transcriptional regulator